MRSLMRVHPVDVPLSIEHLVKVLHSTYLVAEGDAIEEQVVLLSLLISINIIRIRAVFHQERRHFFEISLHRDIPHFFA